MVDVPVEEHAGSRHQPENWFIEANARWRKVLLNEKLPDPIVEKPLHLWISAGEQPDRISSVALRVRATQRSLYLIAVKEFQIELGWREHEGELKRRRRAKFLYDRRHYDFSLTDPIIQERYCRSFPKPEEGPRIVRLPCDECLLCVSLTPEFHGYHYKIVATVIEQ